MAQPADWTDIQKHLRDAMLRARSNPKHYLQDNPRSPAHGQHRRTTPPPHRHPPAAPSPGVNSGTEDFTIYAYTYPWFEPPEPKPIPHAGIRAGEIVGWRAWRIQHIGNIPYLRSLCSLYVWTPSEVVTGDIYQKMVGPLFYLGLDQIMGGVYAFANDQYDDDIQTARTDWGIDYPSFALGTVHLWGEVVEHERGYRASHAAVRSIDEAYGVDLADLRNRYGV